MWKASGAFPQQSDSSDELFQKVILASLWTFREAGMDTGS